MGKTINLNFIDLEISLVGDLLTINKTREPELYWALRGAGGGMFVIVTEFKFRLVKPPSLVQKFSSTWNSNATKLVIQRVRIVVSPYNPKRRLSGLF